VVSATQPCFNGFTLISPHKPWLAAVALASEMGKTQSSRISDVHEKQKLAALRAANFCFEEFIEGFLDLSDLFPELPY
jgi:hypothetical protein